MEIIIEETLAINLFVNSLILKMSAAFTGVRARLWLLSAFIGALVSLIAPIFSLGKVIKILLQVLTMILMACISFEIKPIKKFFASLFVFLLATFIFGGGCLALQNAVGTFPVFITAAVCGVIYVIAKLLLNWRKREQQIKKFTFNVMLKDGKNIVYEEGYLDSGNMLYDSITKKPIILVSYEVFHKLYGNISYISALTKSVEKDVRDGHYIKINSVGSGASILVFSIDEVKLNSDRTFKDVMLGLSFSGFEKSFGKGVLLHGGMV